VSAPDGCCACFRKAEVFHLPCRNQVLHRARHLLDGHVRINPVLIEQIDGFDLQPLERGLGDLLDVRWLTIQGSQAWPTVGIRREAELGGNHHLPAERRQCFPKEFFVGEWTIDFRRIEEGDAAVNRRVQKSDHLPLVGDRAFMMAHSHATEPKGRDFQIAVSKFSFLHC
jgi:hypothetical protein